MPVVNLRATGFDALEKRLHRVADKVQKTIVRGALRKEAKRASGRIAANITRLDLIDSGGMLMAFERAAIASTSKKGFIRVGPKMPTREDLAIDADDPAYYPFAVEYGHVGAPAHPFIRPAIDEHKDQSYKDIGEDIGKGIEREALK
jgi:HK97 gp10 family phage protein